MPPRRSRRQIFPFDKSDFRDRLYDLPDEPLIDRTAEMLLAEEDQTLDDFAFE